jgi:trehalose 6-phosphate phosphatase
MQEVWASSAISSLAPGRVMLVTDFDGTLAEIVSDPVEAVILPGSLRALERLVDPLRRVAILSSRPTADLEKLVPLAGADLIGDSGVGHLPIEARMRLDSFNAQAAKLLRTFNGVWLEMKPGATAVHYRHSNASFDELMTVLRPVLDATDLIAQPGRRVIEVMPTDRPKGSALERLIEKSEPAGVVCIGDDENDRPMFDLVSALTWPHLILGVGSAEAPADLFAECDLVVSGPEEVSRFLTLMADWASSL